MKHTRINSAPQSFGFQMNQGQNNPEIQFAAHFPSYHLFVTPSATTMLLTLAPANTLVGT